MGASPIPIASVWGLYNGPDYYTNYYMKLLVAIGAVAAAFPLLFKKMRASIPTHRRELGIAEPTPIIA